MRRYAPISHIKDGAALRRSSRSGGVEIQKSFVKRLRAIELCFSTRLAERRVWSS
jgi:hypothetical protein